MTVPPTTPAGWYPDPQSAGTQRYWDGTAWTVHTAPLAYPPGVAGQVVGQTAGQIAGPGAGPGAGQPAHKKMSGGAIAGIVIACTVGVLVVIGILAAIAIPVFLTQREKEADAEAKVAVTDLGREITIMTADVPADALTVEQMGSSAVIMAPDGSSSMTLIPPHVTLGGYIPTDRGTWCVWVATEQGKLKYFQYSSWGGLESGRCSA